LSEGEKSVILDDKKVTISTQSKSSLK